MEDGRTPKSASIRFTRFNNLSAYPVLAEEGVEVGAVDIDFAAYLREGDETFGRGSSATSWGRCRGACGLLRILSIAVGVIGVAPGDEVDDLLQHVMEVAPFFFRHYERQCRGADILQGALH